MQPYLLQEMHPPVASQVLVGTQEAGRTRAGLCPFLWPGTERKVDQALGHNGHKSQLPNLGHRSMCVPAPCSTYSPWPPSDLSSP